jgi:hypothetical protein
MTAIPASMRFETPSRRTILAGEPYGIVGVAGQCVIADGIVRVPLTQGRYAAIDAPDYDLVNRYLWCAQKGYNTFYATTNIRRSDGGWTHLRLHTLLAGYNQTDHTDGNGLNNTRDNMRDASHSQNGANTPKRAGTTSRFKGVSWHKNSGKWIAVIQIDGKSKYLGLYTDEIEAALAYDRAARQIFGEFGRYNFPVGVEQSALT